VTGPRPETTTVKPSLSARKDAYPPRLQLKDNAVAF